MIAPRKTPADLRCRAQELQAILEAVVQVEPPHPWKVVIPLWLLTALGNSRSERIDVVDQDPRVRFPRRAKFVLDAEVNLQAIRS